MNAGGALASAGAAVIYGSAYVATAIALDGYSPAGIGVWRGLFGALLLRSSERLSPSQLGGAALVLVAIAAASAGMSGRARP